MATNNFERRSFPRFNTNLPLKICGTEFSLITETKNISCSGVYCQIKRFIPVMTKLELDMFIPLIVNKRRVEKQIRCVAVVVRIEPEQERESVDKYSVGLFFVQLDNKDRDFILKYLQQAFWVNNN